MQNSGQANPLLDMDFRIPFDLIQAAQVEPAMAQLLSQARGRLAAIAGVPGPRTFENTMHALDNLTEPLDRALGVVRHLESVATYPRSEERRVGTECSSRWSPYD